MLYYLFFFVLHRYWSPLNVFRYITVRTALASLTALFLSLVLGPWVVRRLRAMQIGQYIREEGPESHHLKAGTPTMGGVLIITAIVLPTILWADMRNPYVLIALAATICFAAVGFTDDYLKIARKRNLGLRGRTKLILQTLIACLAAAALVFLKYYDGYSTELVVPFFKRVHPDLVIRPLLAHPHLLAAAYLPFVGFVALVVVGSSNAVNLTDGLDGLAIGCVVIASGALTALTYVTSHAGIADYLDIQKLPLVGEMTIFCGALMGAALGFLWYNAHPAEMFMGDVGSLALGGAIGVVSVIIMQEILLLFIGGIFVLEAVSVILQVASFKLTGRRLFRMAPLHHHFELLGWSESTIIVRFWIAALVFALLSLTTLKLR